MQNQPAADQQTTDPLGDEPSNVRDCIKAVWGADHPYPGTEHKLPLLVQEMRRRGWPEPNYINLHQFGWRLQNWGTIREIIGVSLGGAGHLLVWRTTQSSAGISPGRRAVKEVADQLEHMKRDCLSKEFWTDWTPDQDRRRCVILP